MFFLLCAHLLVYSGVAGGVVSQEYFQLKFGLRTGDTVDQARIDALSSNVVSVLQAGAFFGALGSAPISGESFATLYSIYCSFRSSLASLRTHELELIGSDCLPQPVLDGNTLCWDSV